MGEKRAIVEDAFALDKSGEDSHGRRGHSQKAQRPSMLQNKKASSSFSSEKSLNLGRSSTAQVMKMDDTRPNPRDSPYDGLDAEDASNRFDRFSPASDTSPGNGSPVSGRRRSTIPRWL